MEFDIDEIHRVRLEIAERRAKMTKEEARADRQRSVENVMRTMEELRAKEQAQLQPQN